MTAAAVASAEEPEESQDAVGHRRGPALVRLVPFVEPAAGPVHARGPLIAPPPVAGSSHARVRNDGGHQDRAAQADPRDTRPGRSRLMGAQDTDVPLPDPTPLCCAMVQAAVEALRGARPLAQLARWVSPEIYEQLALRSELTQRAKGRSESTQRAAIRRIRLCRLGEHAAEASVVVDDGQRVRAVAIRLEGHRGQWRATALVIG